MRLLLGTDYATTEEPIWALKELNQPAADFKSTRRWQILTIVRGDKMVELRRDLGPAESFAVDEFAIPGGVADPVTGHIYIEHTVGELLDMADLLRSDKYNRPERPAVSDLIGGYRDLPDRFDRARRGLSMFGEKVRVQRA